MTCWELELILFVDKINLEIVFSIGENMHKAYL